MNYYRALNGVVVEVRTAPHADCPHSTNEPVECGWVVTNGVLDGLTTKKTAKLTAIDAKTSAGIYAGYTYAGKLFSCSDNHQRWALGILVGLSGGNSYTGIAVPTKDNLDSHVIADNADAAAIATACTTHAATWLASGSALKAQVQAATTAAQIDAITDSRI